MKLHTEIKIDAAHQLPNYEGKCSNVHGHTWKIVIELEGDKNLTTGMIVDFVEIKRIVNELDHCNLNEKITNPTAENLAEYLARKFLRLASNIETVTVRVYESESSYIEIITGL